MNKSTIATILGTAALGLLKSKGSKSNNFKDDEIIDNITELESYEDKPQKMFDKIKLISIYEAGYIDWDLIGRFRNLEILSLEDCTGYRVDDKIGNLTKLKSLNLSDNYISYISPEIGKLNNLNFCG